jgi:hypothetical protein
MENREIRSRLILQPAARSTLSPFSPSQGNSRPHDTPKRRPGHDNAAMVTRSPGFHGGQIFLQKIP